MKRSPFISALFVALAVSATAQAGVIQRPPDPPFVQQVALSETDKGENEGFGAFVAISGDTLVVSAPGHSNGPGASRGVAYVYEKPASGWADATKTAELKLSKPTDAIGAVAISGDTIVVGSRDHKVDAKEEQGAVEVFVKPASGWEDANPTAELTASDGAAGDHLGDSVAISGDTVVAGAEEAAFGAKPAAGKAYVFVKPAAGWNDANQTARLRAGDAAEEDNFGASVSVSGGTVVVGSPNHAFDLNNEQGTAYVFIEPASGWTDTTETAGLKAQDGAAGDKLGSAVGVSGDTVVAGAPERQGGAGAAYVFVKPRNGWSLVGKQAEAAELTATDRAAQDNLGLSVAIDGDRVVAGSPPHRVGANALQGAVYSFVQPVAGWADATQSDELSAVDGGPSDVFGLAVAISGNFVAAGTPFASGGAPKPIGAAYVFGLPPTIAIAAPANGATFRQHQVVAAAYSCSPPINATITTCAGPVAAGAPIDTKTLGRHTFVVSASDSEGVSTTKTVRYTVEPRLSITALRQSASVWRTGTTFSFRLSRRAALALRFTRGKAAAGTLRLSGHRGVNRVRFRGRVSRTTKLRPGRYSLRITASAARERSTSRKLNFTIVR